MNIYDAVILVIIIIDSSVDNIYLATYLCFLFISLLFIYLFYKLLYYRFYRCLHISRVIISVIVMFIYVFSFFFVSVFFLRHETFLSLYHEVTQRTCYRGSCVGNRKDTCYRERHGSE